MNKQTIVLIAVAVVAAIAAVLVLLPSEGPVTVPKTTAQGTATVTPSGTETMVPTNVTVPAAPTPSSGRMTSSLDYEPHPVPNPQGAAAGLIPQPGIPLDVHGQKDSHVWIGMYRMMLRDNGGPTDLGDRVHDMATKVAGVTSANDVAAYAPLFAEERKLVAEVRAATSNEQILANCDMIEEAITAIEAGRLHPSDKEFETADAGAAAP